VGLPSKAATRPAPKLLQAVLFCTTSHHTALMESNYFPKPDGGFKKSTRRINDPIPVPNDGAIERGSE